MRNKFMYVLFGAGIEEAYEEGGVNGIIKAYEANEIGYECYQHNLSDTSLQNTANLLSMMQGNSEYFIVSEEEFDQLL